MSYQIEQAIIEASRADPNRGISADVMKSYGLAPSKLMNPKRSEKFYVGEKEIIRETYKIGRRTLNVESINSVGKHTYQLTLTTPVKGAPIIEFFIYARDWREILEERLVHEEQAPHVQHFRRRKQQE